MRIARFYQKTLFGMFALMGLIVVSTSVLYVRTVDRQLTDDFQTSSRAIARTIANSNIDAIVTQNYSALQSTIDQYVEIPGISYVFVVDANVYDRALAGLGSFSEVTAGVVAGEAGRVHVGMDKGYVALQVQTAIGNEVYLLTIIFVVSVLAAYGLMYQVSKPLDHLGSYAWHSLSSEEHVSPPPPHQLERLLARVDEVGELGRLIRGASRRQT